MNCFNMSGLQTRYQLGDHKRNWDVFSQIVPSLFLRTFLLVDLFDLLKSSNTQYDCEPQKDIQPKDIFSVA